MLWLNTSGRAPITVASASSSTPRKSGVSTSTVHPGSFALQRADRRRVVAGAAVGDVVAVDRGDDDVLEAHLRGGLRDPERLERVAAVAPACPSGRSSSGRRGCRCRRGSGRSPCPAPALGDVRAARLLADRVQARAVDQLLDVEVAPVRARRAHLHPLRTARPLGDGKRLCIRRSRAGTDAGRRSQSCCGADTSVRGRPGPPASEIGHDGPAEARAVSLTRADAVESARGVVAHVEELDAGRPGTIPNGRPPARLSGPRRTDDRDATAADARSPSRRSSRSGSRRRRRPPRARRRRRARGRQAVASDTAAIRGGWPSSTPVGNCSPDGSRPCGPARQR